MTLHYIIQNDLPTLLGGKLCGNLPCAFQYTHVDGSSVHAQLEFTIFVYLSYLVHTKHCAHTHTYITPSTHAHIAITIQFTSSVFAADYDPTIGTCETCVSMYKSEHHNTNCHSKTTGLSEKKKSTLHYSVNYVYAIALTWRFRYLYYEKW